MATKKQLKICILTPYAIGISETFIQAVLDGLDGHVVHLRSSVSDYYLGDSKISASDSIKPRSLDRLLDLLPRFLEFRLRRAINPPPSRVTLTAEFLKRMQFDIVLAQYGTIAADILPACRIAQIPLVPHFHGFDTSRRSTLETYHESYNELFTYCKKIIVVSKRMRQDLVEMGCPRDKLEHITYAPHESYFDVTPNYASNNLIMVGRLTDQKAPHLSILAFAEAAKKHSNLHLRIIGDGELYSVCRDLINGLNLSDKITLLGSRDRSFIQKEFSNSSLFLQHSIEAANGDREGTPVAILEAGASGLPVVSTFHAGISDVVTPELTGILVNEGNIRDMSKAICELAENRDKLKKLGMNAKSHVKQHFSMKQHLNSIISVLHKAACKNNGY